MYCSYRGSPVEFTLGAFNYTNDSDEKYIYISKEEAENETVRDLLYNGTVKEVYGKLPSGTDGEAKYICLIKNLECDFTDEYKMPSIKYGNFVFETDDRSLYNRMFNNLKRIKNRLNEYLDRLVIPDQYVDVFRLKIDNHVFKEFYAEITKKVDTDVNDALIIITNESNMDKSDELSDLLKTNVIKKKDNVYICKKKIPLIIPILLSLVICLVILVLNLL